MWTAAFFSTPLFLWHGADGFSLSSSRLSAPAAAAGSAASCSSRAGGWSSTLHPLSVSTQTEEDLREKLARDNEDLSQVDSKVLDSFGGVSDAQFLTEIKKERPYFAVLAERASETVDSILSSASTTKESVPRKSSLAKPRGGLLL
ncbi:unnamed protein product [Pylaiella littoralis]